MDNIDLLNAARYIRDYCFSNKYCECPFVNKGHCGLNGVPQQWEFTEKEDDDGTDRDE